MRCGRLLAEAGYYVATGGYGGIMEAVSRGAAEAGGTVIAVTAPALFPDRAGANKWATLELPQPTLSLRIGELIDQSVATIALPGSIGTLTELIVAWNDAYLAVIGGRRPKPVVVVGKQWNDIVDSIGETVGGNPELVTRVTDVAAAVAAVATVGIGRGDSA